MAPLLLIKQEYPFSLRQASIKADVVVLPLVPVTQMIYVSFDKYDNILGFSISATLPGKVVAPRLKICSTNDNSLAIIIVIIIVNYIELFSYYDIINKTNQEIIMLQEIIEIVKKAGEIYRSADKDKGVEQKGSNVNLVTKYDKMIQDYLVDELTKIVPNANFLDEEGDDNKELTDGYCFIIDPIDGTTNFIKGFQHSAISVGLAKDKELIIGVVLDPDLDNIFYAEKGNGAYLNGERISVSDCTLENSLVLFGTCPYEHELAHKTFELTEKVFYKALEVRRGGSAALDICYVAAGKADLYYELILRPWDWAGATLILREAGGAATTVDGEELDANEIKSYLCGNKKNIEEFYGIYNA